MMFSSVGSVAFEIFNFPIYYYGIILALAIFIGIYTAYFLYKKFYDIENSDKILDFSPFMVIWGIVGARLYYCIVNYSYYMHNPLEIFDVRQGGLSIHGMIIVGVAALLFYSKVYKLSFLKLCDVFMCGTALAQSIGRWGNFFNDEAFGTPTNLPWKLFIPEIKRPMQYMDNSFFHPTFLYESVLDFIIFIVLILLFKKFSKKPGIIACLYLIMYSIVRIFVEQFRIDSVLNINGIPVAQVVSLTILIFTIMIFPFILKRYKN